MKTARRVYCVMAAVVAVSCTPNPIVNQSDTNVPVSTTIPAMAIGAKPVAKLAVLGAFVTQAAVATVVQIHKKKVAEKANATLSEPIPVEEPVVASQDELEAGLAPMTEVFWIDPHHDTMISCEKGTKIFFPANIFFGKTNGDIEISVEEYYGAADLISKDLATVSNGEILESGGTIRVTAEMNQRSLELKKDEAYMLLFPRNGNPGQMQTFYGEFDDNDQMNWDLAKIETPVGDQAMNTSDFERAIMSVFDHETSKYDHPEWKLKNEKRSFFEYFEQEFNQLPGAEDAARFFYANERRIYASIACDNDGTITSVQLSQWSTPYNKMIEEFLTQMPRLNMRSMYMNNYGYYTISFGSRIQRDDEKFRKAFRTKYEKYGDLALQEANSSDLEYFVLASQQLGWINCDKFLEPYAGIVNLEVDVNTTEPVKTYLIFEDFSAVVNGESKDGSPVLYKGAPFNERIKLVGITYSPSGQPLISVVETKISDDKIVLPEFKPFSISELEEMLD